jgi:class 3 adenylate cyclase/WD40 repeat protein
MAPSRQRQEQGSAIRTFLIADVRGYTRFTATEGDEAASRLALRFAEVCAEGVEAWGGELVELRGDEALCVFGSARQALRAAVELQSAFADETASDPALPLGVGIGLDAGEAVPVGEGFRGAALNLAARLCAIAGPGEVLASDGLVRLAGRVEGLVTETREPVAMKGYDEAVAFLAVRADGASEATAPVAPRDEGGGPADTGAPDAAGHVMSGALPTDLDPIVPLAGRERELRWLRWHWRRARHGHGRLVILAGPPGIGKTRLAAELASRAHADGALVAYVPAGRPPADHGLPAETDLPLIVVLDDLDAAGAEVTRFTTRQVEALPGRRVLLLATHRLEAQPSFVTLTERLAPPEQRRVIGPLEPDAVRAITALYAGSAADDAPLGEILAESAGVPAAVHRVASRWARAAATRRLGASAERTSVERRGLRAAEDALARDMADLELAGERERLFISPEEAGDGDGTAPARAVCPYKGLAEFEAADAEHYFGRERLISELVAKLVGSRFLAVVGDSGSGKSSALRAGLLPALAGGVLPGSEAWPQAVLRPGEHPLAELERALARCLPDLDVPAGDAARTLDAAVASLGSGQRLVVVVDQFEEVFNATRDEAERSAFLELLTTERPGLKVIVSLRADHYGRCAVYPALARLVGSDQLLVGPLTSAELAAVIEHPAQRVGLRVEPALTDALVADAGREPGALPLLSTTLLELWGAREGGRMTLAAYRASGGLQGAIARLAEATFAELDPHRQQVARALLLRLAGPGEGTALVRRRVSLDELDAERDAGVAEVLERLTAARLLTAGEGSVEVAHEALLREWPRLQDWLAEDAAGREIRLHLMGAVRDWEGRGREPGDLYRGARLASALDWAAEHQVELNSSERSFLEASREAAEREVERERRTNRRLRFLLGGAGVLLVAAVAAGGFAFAQAQRAEEAGRRAEGEAARATAQEREIAVRNTQLMDRARQLRKQKRRAEDEAARATAEARRARAGELIASALAVRDEDPGLGKLLAVEALGFTDEPTVGSTGLLHAVLAADPVKARYRWPADREVDSLWVDLAPAGDRLAASGAVWGPSDHLEVADARTGEVLWSYDVGTDGMRVGPSFFSPDGTRVIAGVFYDHHLPLPDDEHLGVIEWDAMTGEVLERHDLGPCGALVTALAGDRALVLADPIEWADGRSRQRPVDPRWGCDWYYFPQSPRLGTLGLSADEFTPISPRTFIGTGGTLSGDGRRAGFEEYRPDGSRTSIVLDLDTGERAWEFDPLAVDLQNGAAYARTLVQDGSLLLYGDRPILVFDLEAEGAEPVEELPGKGGEGEHAIFDPSGERVLATARDRVLREWDARSGEELGAWSAVGDGRIAIAADGRTVLVGDTPSRSASLLDLASGGDLGSVDTCPAFTPAGSLDTGDGLAVFYAVCDDEGGEGRMHVVDLAARRLLASWPGFGSQELEMSPDGTRVLAQPQEGFMQGPLVIVDPRSGETLVTLEGLCTWDGAIGLEGQAQCKPWPEKPFDVWLAHGIWSPDGSMVAVAHGNVTVWDARDGRMLHTTDLDTDEAAFRLLFTPDSRSLLVSEFDGAIKRLDTETWEVTQELALDTSRFGLSRPGLAGFTADGTDVVVVGGEGGGGASLYWLDAETLEMGRYVPDAHSGSLKSFSLSPDGGQLATGASDGQVRVWDAASGKLLDQVTIGDTQVQGLDFISDGQLAVAPREGGLLLLATDSAELERIVRGSLTRGFSETECRTYGIAPCPTLEEMRSGGVAE